MKWFECQEDLGDGSTTTRRFRTEEAAKSWLAQMIDEYGDPAEFGVYPYGELDWVDTDSPSFWDDEE